MNDQTHNQQDDDLEGFDTFENETLTDDQMMADEPIDDADFQDISDEVDADVFGEGEPAPKPAKKTSWFNIGVAAIAILVAGGLIFMKLGPTLLGGDAASPSAVSGNNSGAPAVALNNNSNNTNNAQAAAQAALAPNGAGAENSPSLLDSPDQYANLGTPTAPLPAAPVAPPVSGDDPFAGVPAQPAAPSAVPAATPDTAQSSVPMPAPIAPAPTLDTQPQQAAAPMAPAAMAPAPVASAPIQTAAPMADDGTLATKVSQLETRLNDMDSKLNTIASAPAADDGRLNAIQTSLERLETRLDDIAARKTPVREASAPAATTPVITGTDEPAPVVKKQAPRKASKPKTTKSNQWDGAYSPAKATQASTGSGKWELRGAMPGRATLARGNDIREVGVGESVPGLGEITGVAQMGGRWIVQGTQGAVTQ